MEDREERNKKCKYSDQTAYRGNYHVKTNINNRLINSVCRRHRTTEPPLHSIHICLNFMLACCGNPGFDTLLGKATYYIILIWDQLPFKDDLICSYQ